MNLICAAPVEAMSSTGAPTIWSGDAACGVGGGPKVGAIGGAGLGAGADAGRGEITGSPGTMAGDSGRKPSWPSAGALSWRRRALGVGARSLVAGLVAVREGTSVRRCGGSTPRLSGAPQVTQKR